MELKEKIAETVRLNWLFGYKDSFVIADQILALPLEDIEVEKECIYDLCPRIKAPWRSDICPECGNTGKIHRPATWQDIDIKHIIEGLMLIVGSVIEKMNKEEVLKDHIKIVKSILKTPDGGRLVLKK